MSYQRSSGGGKGGTAGGASGSKRGPAPSAVGSGAPAQIRHGPVAPKSGHMAGNVAAGQPAKSMAAFRSLELCDRLKLEIENITSEISAHQVEREEYEKKFRQQLLEMDRIQHSLKQLQEAHVMMKQQYEDEIDRLRHKLDSHPHAQGSEGESRAGGNTASSASGALSSLGSAALAGHGHSSSPQTAQMANTSQGLPGAGTAAGHMLASPRRREQPAPGGQGSGRGGSMPGSHLSQMAVGGPPVMLPNVGGRRARPADDEHGRGGALGPNGQLVEPTSKRPRTMDSAHAGVTSALYLPPHAGLHPSHGFDVAEGSTGGDPLRGGLQRGMGPAAFSGMSLDGLRREAAVGAMGGPGGRGVAESGDAGGEGGVSSAVDIPDAIPAERFGYEVNYESEETGGEGAAKPSRLAVELAKSQDLRSVVCCVRFSTDGSKIAAGSHSCVKVFDVVTFRQLYVCWKVYEQGRAEPDPYVRAVCFSPDGQSIVAGMEQNSAKVLLLREGGARQGAITLSGHQSEVYSLDWVSTMIASGSGDGRIRLWDAASGACEAAFGDAAGPQHGITSVVLRQDTRTVAAASIDRVVHVWSTQTHKLLHRLDGHTQSVYAVTFSHDGSQLVSGGLDKTIKVWDLGPGTEGQLSPQAQTLPGGHSDYVLSVCFSKDGKYIISGSKDRSVTLWDATKMVRVATVTGFKNSVIGVSASPTNEAFATGSGDNLVCVWMYGDSASGSASVATVASAGDSSAGKSSPSHATQPEDRPRDDEAEAARDSRGSGADSSRPRDGSGPSPGRASTERTHNEASEAMSVARGAESKGQESAGAGQRREGVQREAGRRQGSGAEGEAASTPAKTGQDRGSSSKGGVCKVESPERRTMPPKKDMQRRDSPPFAEG